MSTMAEHAEHLHTDLVTPLPDFDSKAAKGFSNQFRSGSSAVCTDSGDTGAGLGFGARQETASSPTSGSASDADTFDDDEMEASQEDIARAKMESLQGVTYTVHVIVPEGPVSETTTNTYLFHALEFVGDIQWMLETETNRFGTFPMLLVFNGQALPPHIPLHFVGVRDGSTVALVMARSKCEPQFECWAGDEDDFDDDDPVLDWVSGR
jgi:hypothetical protein